MQDMAQHSTEAPKISLKKKKNQKQQQQQNKKKK